MIIDISHWSGKREVVLDTQHQEIEIRGVFVVKDTESVNLDLRIIHSVPQTRATTSIRAVVYGSGSLNIQGTIEIKHEAPNSESFLTMRALLLGKKAVATLVPNLEIFNNEVKCSHAATISPPPEEQVFYLQSRGLEKSQAESLLVDAFLEGVDR